MVMTINQRNEELEEIEIFHEVGQGYSLFNPPESKRALRLNPWITTPTRIYYDDDVDAGVLAP